MDAKLWWKRKMDSRNCCFMSYIVSDNGQKSRRHIDQLKKRARKENDCGDTCDDFMQVSSGRAALD